MFALAHHGFARFIVGLRIISGVILGVVWHSFCGLRDGAPLLWAVVRLARDYFCKPWLRWFFEAPTIAGS